MLGKSEILRNDTAEALEVGARNRKRESVFSNGTDEPSHLTSTN
jgi:hypothetical protein